MNESRIDRLSKRHRDVLRGVAALRKSKQIAADLGIAPGTVDGYIAEAVRILGATDRGDAARILVQNDRLDVAAAPSDTFAAPGQSGGQSSGVVPPPPTMKEVALPVVEPEAVRDSGTQPVSLAGWLPVRRAGQRNNDLPVAARLLWIPAIAVILAVGFGMLVSGLKVLVELIDRLGHLSG